MQQKNLQATAEKNSKKEAELTYLTSQDKKQLFQAIYHSSKGIHRKRDIAIFEVTLYCALRASEVSKIKISDYDPVKHTIHCHRLKGSKSNTLKIVDQHVIKSLDDYLEDRLQIKCNTPALFVSQKGNRISRQRLDSLMKKYGSLAQINPEKRHMHVLKHTRAIDLAEIGLDVDDIQFWLGHKNVANTFIYLQYTFAMRQKLFDKLSDSEQGTYQDRY